MKNDITKLIEKIEAFNDTPELCRWIEEFREDMGTGGEVAETGYYLEEIRQNLSGMNDLLQSIKKEFRLDGKFL